MKRVAAVARRLAEAGKSLGRRDEILHLMNHEASEGALFQRQYRIFAVVVLLVLSVYGLRLWHLQVIEGARYRYQSENNRIRIEDLVAPRGMIFDRNGVPLVENRPAYHLTLIREDVQDMDDLLGKVAELTGRPEDELSRVVEAAKGIPGFTPIRLVTDLDRDALARVEVQRVDLPGISVEVEPRREYRWNGTASHLVGYIGEIAENEMKSDRFQGYLMGEAVGKIGIEKSFEETLHGHKGGRQVEVNAVGRRVRLLADVLPAPGRNLWLTIDIEFQKKVEEILGDRSGAIVAMDPKTGGILALASHPTFDQEAFVRGLKKEDWRALSDDPRHPLLNRALRGAYPPGSTFKPIVALAALQEGLITPETKLNCPGYFELGDHRFRCWKEHGHGAINVHRALVESCDVFFYQVGLRLGVDKIAEYAKAFGLGEESGISLDSEHPGLIPTSAWKKTATGIPWQKGETVSVAIGQGFVLATPLQMAAFYCALANGGTLWQPRVARRIEGQGETSELTGIARRQVPVDKRWIALVQKALTGVVEEPAGTGKIVRQAAFQTAGKTGTAQVVRLPENANRKLLEKLAKNNERDHAWFTGWAPAQNPQIVVAVLYEHGGHGASDAGPLAKEVLSAWLSRK